MDIPVWENIRIDKLSIWTILWFSHLLDKTENSSYPYLKISRFPYHAFLMEDIHRLQKLDNYFNHSLCVLPGACLFLSEDDPLLCWGEFQFQYIGKLETSGIQAAKYNIPDGEM